MTLSNYPNQIDNDANLYLVHDSLRVKLADDYLPGDTRITVYDERNVMSLFPPSGIITLTEQCSEPELRAISLSYSSKTSTTFEGLQLRSGFVDVVKPKNITNVTLNVMAEHHNTIKDAVIAVQGFVGIEGTTDEVAYGPTIEGRLNYLRRLVFTPRAWFSADTRMGLVPMEVKFSDESTHIGEGTVTYSWDFGDGTTGQGKTVTKTYTQPGKYTVKLIVTNSFGTNSVQFPEFINARVPAPDQAVILLSAKTDQRIMRAGDPIGGPYTTTPIIRSPINSSISVEITQGINAATGRSYAGEEMVNSVPRDPVEEYTWTFGDDLLHSNNSQTTAMFSVGGIYDLVLRVDTQYGAYRITSYPGAFNIIESQNIWLWTFPGALHPAGQYDALDFLKLDGNITSHEFGLLSETFKTSSTQWAITRSDTFLDDTENYEQAKREFRRNVAFATKGYSPSGSRGSNLLFYASSSSSNPASDCTYWDHMIRVLEYSGFEDTYADQDQIIRPWNWVCLPSTQNANSYFLFGASCDADVPGENPSNQMKTSYDSLTMTATSATLSLSDYENGAEELMSHPSTYDKDGVPLNGKFAVYRTAWKGTSGYILRNSGVGDYFRIANFYKTAGTLGTEFQSIHKLVDMTGPLKLEGQLVALADGLFFFNNTGNISAYNDQTGVWETGGASTGSVSFRSLQDSTIQGFDSASNTLLATSNGDRNAYLSFDYSNAAFTKFNSLELTFLNIGPRPGWEDRTRPQFAMGMY
jgi:PKD repeat protein